jgi:hypothetical protein
LFDSEAGVPRLPIWATHGVFRHHFFGVVSCRYPATSPKAHSSLSPNQLHEGFNLLRNLSAVGAEILLQANSTKERDD